MQQKYEQTSPQYAVWIISFTLHKAVLNVIIDRFFVIIGNKRLFSRCVSVVYFTSLL